jgi:hypothetical protein
LAAALAQAAGAAAVPVVGLSPCADLARRVAGANVARAASFPAASSTRGEEGRRDLLAHPVAVVRRPLEQRQVRTPEPVAGGSRKPATRPHLRSRPHGGGARPRRPTCRVGGCTETRMDRRLATECQMCVQTVANLGLRYVPRVPLLGAIGSAHAYRVFCHFFDVDPWNVPAFVDT